MKITWLGHSCFLLTNGAGETVLTDPFDESVGYPLPKTRSDVVTMSHHHHDHDAVKTLASYAHAKDTPERETFGGWTIEGIPTFHDDAQGTKRGKNTVFVLESEGVRVAHMGDLGHMPSDADYAALGKIDVLLIPVGGFYTIDSKQAAQIAKRIGAKYTIPMHYKNKWCDFPITDEKAFAGEMQAQYAKGSTLDTETDAFGTWVLQL